MTKIDPSPDVARAWKDESYRESLTSDQLAALPAHPAGIAELSEEELVAAAGGISPLIAYSASALAGTIVGGSSVYITTR